jgi:hypothetical protein
MSVNGTSGCIADRTQLVDAVMHGYLTWRAETMAVTDTYKNWTCTPRNESASAFDTYLEALDREEQAADAYQCLLEQAAS